MLQFQRRSLSKLLPNTSLSPENSPPTYRPPRSSQINSTPKTPQNQEYKTSTVWLNLSIRNNTPRKNPQNPRLREKNENSLQNIKKITGRLIVGRRERINVSACYLGKGLNRYY